MEFKIVGILVWIAVTILGFNQGLYQLCQKSDNAVAIGGGIIVAVVLANIFLVRSLISKKRKKE